MERYICIHGHFYQPPRENPWLEAIELQDSAYPYHDWNERITAECYEPNGLSRILDERGRIVRIVNNYARISFNFGPTLLSWMARKVPEVYDLILEADRESQERFSGHGSALAQAYNHIIMPLANYRDKYTQVLWGIRDFEHRFGRRPEGMWLPETAVDLETLDILAACGIAFTILSPYQAGRIRRLGGRAWRDCSGGRIDPSTPYRQRLPSGRAMTIFFYDGPISQAVAFERLLQRGEYLADRLLNAFSTERPWPQLVHIATDGETYGHHHRHGDMALAYALDYIDKQKLARLTNYGEYLERHPPLHQVDIVENTAWSCVHGVERWRNDCGCNSGGHPGWRQDWRTPLRDALDWLRDTLTPTYEIVARTLFRDPWQARDNYINVVLERSSRHFERFLNQHATHALNDAEQQTAIKLLELQRHAMLMYTSCGWFFDEVSGIETVQVIQYAARAIQLAEELFGTPLEQRFLTRIENAASNIPAHRDGRWIYTNFVKPAMVDWRQVGAHYAIRSVFEPYAEEDRIYCYRAVREDYQGFEAGRLKLVLGQARVTSEITGDAAVFNFGVVHFGDHNLNGGVRAFTDAADYQALTGELREVFSRADFPEVIRLLDRHFGESSYSLRSLFRDEQRKIINLILASTLAEAEAAYRQLYERHVPLMRFLTDLHVPQSQAFQAAAEFVLNLDLRRALEAEALNRERIEMLLDNASSAGVTLDTTLHSYALRQNLRRLAKRFADQAADLSLLQALVAAVDLAHRLPFEIDLWRVQNICYRIQRTVYPALREQAAQGDDTACLWLRHFFDLAEKLAVHIE